MINKKQLKQLKAKKIIEQHLKKEIEALDIKTHVKQRVASEVFTLW